MAMSVPVRHLRLVTDDDPIGRPRTRGECAGGPRPCPYVSCRQNLALDVLPGGKARLHWSPDEEPDRPSCAPDVADLGGLTMNEVATILGVVRQRITQIEEGALRRIKKSMKKASE